MVALFINVILFEVSEVLLYTSPFLTPLSSSYKIAKSGFKSLFKSPTAKFTLDIPALVNKTSKLFFKATALYPSKSPIGDFAAESLYNPINLN